MAIILAYPVNDIIHYLDKEKLNKIKRTTVLKYILTIYKKQEALFDKISEDIGKCTAIHAQNRDDKNQYCDIFNRLIEEKVFKGILNRDYENDLQAHIDIYYVILAWEDLDRSFLITCQIGAQGDNKDYAADFYNLFIFPFLENLLINPIILIWYHF